MQNYSNHTRFFPLHHFILTPLTLASLGLCIYRITATDLSSADAILLLFSSIALVLLAFISRIYAIKNQDRIIRLEVRLRYFELTGKSLEEKEAHLTKGQIVAIRFAGKEEFLALLEKAQHEKLSPKEIKRSIKDWKADLGRV